MAHLAIRPTNVVRVEIATIRPIDDALNEEEHVRDQTAGRDHVRTAQEILGPNHIQDPDQDHDHTRVQINAEIAQRPNPDLDHQGQANKQIRKR